MVNFKTYKKIALILLDIIIILMSYIVATLIRFDFRVSVYTREIFLDRIFYIIAIYVVFFLVFRLYSSLWTVAGLDEYLKVVSANVVGAVISTIYSYVVVPRIPLSVTVFASTMILLGTLGFRILFRIYRRLNMFPKHDIKSYKKKILIVGAGDAAALIIKEIKNHRTLSIGIVGLVDDNEHKQNSYISGYPVLGTTADINELVQEFEVDEVVIAIPSISHENKKRILDIAQNSGAKLKTLPGVYEIVENGFEFSQIRDVDVTDLLGRKEIKLNNQEIAEYITDKTILITGGGGSIGSELCRQIARLKPRKLIIVDIYENNAYDIENELKRNYSKLNLTTLIASVRDLDKIDSIFKREHPDIVFHAAAHKHVPLMETSPGEAVKNNVFGTLNVAQTAKKYKAQKFILISTDKAVNPTNIMGATKRLCEMIIQTIDADAKDTDYVAVRFGNVLGSNGSVIPLFKKQIADGGPVTLTHREITRYFMTIPEAVQLVLQAGSYAKGGEIFVLDMGEPVKIYDLAINLIRLSGLTPYRDIDVKITGLRPGEKLYEELLMAEEGLIDTPNPLIFVGKPNAFNKQLLFHELDDLKKLIFDYTVDENEIKRKMAEIVGTYKYREIE